MPRPEHPYDLAFASLPEPSLLLDAGGHLAGVNAAATSLLGEGLVASAERGDAVAEALPWLSPAVARVLSGTHEVGFETDASTGHGPRRIAARLRGMRDATGALKGVVAVLRDVTERHELEEERCSAERLEALGHMAAGLAHEVNNPLAAVVAGLSFL
jgi:PAS domain-containing protein